MQRHYVILAVAVIAVAVAVGVFLVPLVLYPGQVLDGTIMKGTLYCAIYPPMSISELDTASDILTVGQRYETGYEPSLGTDYVRVMTFRGYLSFYTSYIPDDANLLDATMQLACAFDGSDTDFYVEIYGDTQPIYGSSLGFSDWDCGTVKVASWHSSQFGGVSNYITITVPVSQVNAKGSTQFELKSSREGTTPSGNEYVNFYSADSSYRPKLLVNYEEPTPEPEPTPPATYTLTITSTANGVTNPTSGTYSYDKGTVVSVKATPNSGYVFDYWQLNGTYWGSTNPVAITMDANYKLHAVFATESTPSPTTYELVVKVEDQAGNILSGAEVIFGTLTTKSTDQNGRATYSITADQTVEVKVSFTKYSKVYQTTKTVTMDKPKTVYVILNRLFRWLFTITYENGTKVDGTLTLESATDLTSVSVVDGSGVAWLKNELYDIVFSASPETDLGTLDVTNDGEATYTLEVTIDPLTGGSSTSMSGSTQTTEDETVEGDITPTLPPSFPLLTILVLIGILIAVAVGVYLFKRKL